MKSQAWKYVDLKSLTRLVLLIVAQQGIAALGTYALAAAGFGIHDAMVFVTWIVVSLGVHLLSPFFEVVVRPLEVDLTYKAYRKFLDDKLISKAASPSIWQQKNLRETFLASIGSESESYLAAMIYVGLDVFAFVLSLFFGVMVIGFAIDASFIPAFLVAGVFSYFTYRFLERRVFVANQREQESKTIMGSYLLTAWENIFFNNKSMVRNYQTSMDGKFRAMQVRSVEATKWRELLVFILCLASSLPVIAAILWVLYSNTGNTGLLIAVLATIPRQLNLLSTFRSIFQALTSLASFEAKFQVLSRNAELKEIDLKGRIRHSEISVQGVKYDSLKALYDGILAKDKGRFEVRGVNGSGKSTLLLALNQEMASSFYLPASPQFDIPNMSADQSTGEKLIRHLEYIQTLDEKFILLDEWDANLDSLNIQKVHALLGDISQSKVIIEVRHRAD